MNRKLSLGILVSLVLASVFCLGLGQTNSSFRVGAAARAFVTEHLGPEVRVVEQRVYPQKPGVWAVEGVLESARGQEDFNLVLRYEDGEYRPVTATIGGETRVFRR